MDPVTFSIIRHRLFRVVEEAVITVPNCAFAMTFVHGIGVSSAPSRAIA